VYYSGLRVNTFLIFENDLSKDIVEKKIDSDFIVLKPTIQQLNMLRKGKDLPAEFYYDKICNVKTCYVLLSGKELAYIHWVFFKGDKSRFLKLSENVAELNYNVTIPKFRGRRLSAKVMAYISSDLKFQGYKKVMGVINKKNIASIKCIKEAGFMEIKKIRALGPFHRSLKVIND
jgi:hypothetical protein